MQAPPPGSVLLSLAECTGLSFAATNSGERPPLKANPSFVSFYADFLQVGRDWFRYDTRIYLNGQPQSQSQGHCIAAVVGKNPGSARQGMGAGWQPLKLNGDQMLPFVRKRFIEAFAQASLAIPNLAYVQVLNLFYLCDKELEGALRRYGCITSPRYCTTENLEFRIVWFAWGDDDPELNPF